MTQPEHAVNRVLSTLDIEAQEALRSAVGAAAMLGPERVQALLDLPDAQLGRLFKLGVAQLVGLAAMVTFDCRPSSTRDRKQISHAKKGSKPVASADLDVPEFGFRAAERQALVVERKLLPAPQFR